MSEIHEYGEEQENQNKNQNLGMGKTQEKKYKQSVQNLKNGP